MSVYKIISEPDDYESLLELDSKIAASDLTIFDGASKKNEWPEVLEYYRYNVKKPVPDIYSRGTAGMIIYDRSLDLLGPVLSKSCELLPVCWEDKRGFLVNPLGVVDCIDPERTEWRKSPRTGKKLRITKFHFHLDKLPEQPIFKIEENFTQVFCSDAHEGNFVDLVKKHNLTGFRFEKVHAT